MLPAESGNKFLVVLKDGLVVMYRECPFCGATHCSPYVDELEGIVKACRDRAAPNRKSTLASWGDRDTLPIRPEIEAYAIAEEREWEASSQGQTHGPRALDQEATG